MNDVFWPQNDIPPGFTENADAKDVLSGKFQLGREDLPHQDCLGHFKPVSLKRNKFMFLFVKSTKILKAKTILMSEKRMSVKPMYYL